jgi:hypothetical protein
MKFNLVTSMPGIGILPSKRAKTRMAKMKKTLFLKSFSLKMFKSLAINKI